MGAVKPLSSSSSGDEARDDGEGTNVDRTWSP